MTPEARNEALETALVEHRAAVKAYADHNAELRRHLRAARWQSLGLSCCLVAIVLVRACR